jgi:hypothetical protein
MLDPLDYFLLSAILGSLAASSLKNYLSEEKALKRLKNSIIKKSKLVRQFDRPIFNSKETRIKNIYKVALENRGGQFENFQADHEFSNEVFNLANQIKQFVERLARFLKERELKGVARIFFKNGRLILDLLLCTCKIDITYAVLTEGFNPQVIIITVTAGGAAGFALSWFSAGASLVAPPLLISILSLRSMAQQILDQRNFAKFKKLVTKALEDPELKQTLSAVFLEGEVPKANLIEMKPLDSNKNTLPEFNFESDQTLEEFIKAKMEKELGLVENPTQEKLEEIVDRIKINRKRKGKTTYFKDFIDEIAEGPDDIIDAEIVDKRKRVQIKNEEF